MLQSYEKASAYLHRRTGVCVIEHMCRHPQGYGSLSTATRVEVTPEQFESQVAPALIAALDRYQLPPTTPDIPEVSAREWSRFLEAHKVVSVTRFHPGDIELMPMGRDRGGLRGRKEHAIVVRLSDGAQTLAAALQRAFDFAE